MHPDSSTPTPPRTREEMAGTLARESDAVREAATALSFALLDYFGGKADDPELDRAWDALNLALGV